MRSSLKPFIVLWTQIRYRLFYLLKLCFLNSISGVPVPLRPARLAHFVLFFLSNHINTPIQIMTESAEPAEEASPIGKSVSVKYFDAK